MSSVFDHLHIKQHTAGSSNELSFDVLDAARKDLDTKKRKKSSGPLVLRPPRMSDASDESFHAASGRSSLAGQDEVARRKHNRKVRHARLWILVFAIAVVLVGAAAYVGYGHYNRMHDFRDRFESVVNYIVIADKYVPDVEEFMNSPFDASKARREEITTMIGESRQAAEVVKHQEETVRPFAVSDRDSTALEQVVLACDARMKMMQAAQRAVEVANASATETSEVNAIWNSVVKADQAARAASAQANKAATEDDIREAKKQTQEVKELFEAAYEQLVAIDGKSGDLNLSQHLSYLETRIRSFDHALATSDALVKGDKEKAQYENEAYNAVEREAASIAKDLPVSLDETVEDSFEEDMKACQDDYQAARDAAIEADSIVREYLEK